MTKAANRSWDFGWQEMVGLLALVFGLDTIGAAVASSTVEIGVLDEPAHLATAALLLIPLIALVGRLVPKPFLIAALFAAVALDLDHIPQYLGWDGLTEGVTRPFTHSLATMAVLVLFASMGNTRSRQVALGAAFGVGAHLLRDLATADGVPLLWPFSRSAVQIPYLLYAAVLLLVTAAMAIFALRGGHSGSPFSKPYRDTG